MRHNLHARVKKFIVSLLWKIGPRLLLIQLVYFLNFESHLFGNNFLFMTVVWILSGVILIDVSSTNSEINMQYRLIPDTTDRNRTDPGLGIGSDRFC